MPTTRKKIIKTVYKDDDQSDQEESGDFSDSGSEAHISEESASSDEDIASDVSSSNEFSNKTKTSKTKTATKKSEKTLTVKKPIFSKSFLNKIKKKQSSDDESVDPATKFSVKDLTEADKLLPSVLNLSESDSSDDEGPSTSKKAVQCVNNFGRNLSSDSETEPQNEYKDVWSKNIPDNSEEVAKKTFSELEKHKLRLEETKASVQLYSGNNSSRNDNSMEVDVNDLLAQGEVSPVINKPQKKKKARHNSDSEMEDWEEVKEQTSIPKQGIQLFVEFPDGACRKSKKVDVEMMMRRKINRVKKEYQIYMHKVHVLCWIGHGNYASRVLNDQDVMAAALSLVPSKECYPGERVDMKFVEQITTWFNDKLTLKQDKNEDKFKPKAPPLKEILLSQIKTKVVTAKKYLVFIYISILRAMGLQCRLMYNFVTLPIKPPQTELCSLSTKKKDNQDSKDTIKKEDEKKVCKSKSKSKKNIKQLDGTCDSSTDYDDCYENIMQLDGNDDTTIKQRKTRTTRTKANNVDSSVKLDESEDVSPPKRAKVVVKNEKKTVADSDIKEIKRQVKQKCSQKGAELMVQDVKEQTETNESVKPQKDIIEPKKSVTKRSCPSPRASQSKEIKVNKTTDEDKSTKKPVTKRSSPSPRKSKDEINNICLTEVTDETKTTEMTKKAGPSPRKTRSRVNKDAEEVSNTNRKPPPKSTSKDKSNTLNPPKIVVTNTEDNGKVSSKYFSAEDKPLEGPKKRLSLSRKRSHTATPNDSEKIKEPVVPKKENVKTRTKSAPGTKVEKSEYFKSEKVSPAKNSSRSSKRVSKQDLLEDKQRVSHRDIAAKALSKINVKEDLVEIIKRRVGEAKADTKKRLVKGKQKPDSGEDSDFLPEEDLKNRNSDSDGDFKPSKISPKPPVKRKIDRRVLSSDDEQPKNKINVWCEVFVEELEQWISVDVIRARVHCASEIYSRATHPVCYVIGWDNNNYLKDLTRRYVPQWNTVTRKQRVEANWMDTALALWRGPRTPRDREEDEALDRMQLEAPLPKSIAEYKNHPLYALSRHLLKFEAIYPPDAATLGFVRGEAVYARECVYTCRSRDTWLKDAKTVKVGEKPYKVVKARPKWDKLSNKVITDLPLEVFGPWQVQDYEPPTAENGIVPRNAYGNVELFKDCMLPKGTVHIKLPGLNKVAKKLNIDCAPAMTGFDFNGGFTHPVYDGFVVCKEFEDIITQAWELEQEEQERRENEKLEARVYGNWKRLIKGLLIRERLKDKYGFQEPPKAKPEKKKAGPRFVAKKNA